jgi:hypothetical protein
MDDHDIIGRIDELITEEHGLRHPGGQGLRGDEPARLRHVEEALDQCWDLLRQRRARIDAGQDPGEAQVRPVDEVESYLQ